MVVASDQLEERLNALTHDLAILRPDAPSPLARVADELGELMGGHGFTYQPVLGPDGWRFEWLHGRGPTAGIADGIHALWNDHGTDDNAFYSPGRPEASQRNEVLRPADLVSEEHYCSVPAYDLFETLGVHRMDQLRVLLCDGPVLLGWLGGFREERFTEREHELLQRLRGPVLERLRLERVLSGTVPMGFALDAALGAVPSAAAIVDDAGSVLFANEAFWSLGLDPRTLARSLAEAMRARRPHPRWHLRRVDERGCPRYHLALHRRPIGYDEQLERRARAWNLTPRQTEVLEHVVLGRANKEIAMALGCALRTVEVHVGAVLAKAGCDRRVELIARFHEPDA